MSRLNLQDRARIVGLRTEGMSLRAITRQCDVSINTVTKLLVDVGVACDVYQSKKLRNLPCERDQVDEIWLSCGMKQKNVPPMRRGEFGRDDVYTRVAIDGEKRPRLRTIVLRCPFQDFTRGVCLYSCNKPPGSGHPWDFDAFRCEDWEMFAAYVKRLQAKNKQSRPNG